MRFGLGIGFHWTVAERNLPVTVALSLIPTLCSSLSPPSPPCLHLCPLQFTESSQSAVSSPLPSAVHWVLPVRRVFTSVLCSSLSPPSPPCLHLCPLQFTESSQSAVCSPLSSAVHWVLPVRRVFTSALCSSLNPPSPPCLHLCPLQFTESSQSAVSSPLSFALVFKVTTNFLSFGLPSQDSTEP
jgi:hypothetical protein